MWLLSCPGYFSKRRSASSLNASPAHAENNVHSSTSPESCAFKGDLLSHQAGRGQTLQERPRCDVTRGSRVRWIDQPNPPVVDLIPPPYVYLSGHTPTCDVMNVRMLRGRSEHVEVCVCVLLVPVWQLCSQMRWPSYLQLHFMALLLKSLSATSKFGLITIWGRDGHCPSVTRGTIIKPSSLRKGTSTELHFNLNV